MYLRPSLIYVDGGMGLPGSQLGKESDIKASDGFNQEVTNDSESKSESTSVDTSLDGRV